MKHLASYLNFVKPLSSALEISVAETASALFDKITSKFDFKSHLSGLLLGNVQSGKTAQMLGSIAKLADEGFELFILLTTDNIQLQQQTHERATKGLITFQVCGENDDLEFIQSKLDKPIILILKRELTNLRF